MTIQQWLIDRAAARDAEARALRGEPPAKDGDGMTLTIPGMVWEGPNRHLRGWAPPERPIEIDPRDLWRREHARALADEVLSQADPELVEAARTAMASSQAASVALRTLESEKRDLVEPLSESAVLASLTIDKRLAAARQQAEQANSKVIEALDRLRRPMLEYLAGQIAPRERNAARAMDEQAEQLEQQAGDIRIAAVNARSLVENFLPPAAEPVELSKGRTNR